MRIRVIQSEDSGWDFSEKIRSAIEGKIVPLELDLRTVGRFYETLPAVSDGYDINIVLFFPKKEESAIAGPILAELIKGRVKTIFYFAEDVGVYEDEIIASVLKEVGV